MAIEKTIFTGVNQEQNRPEVYAWLTANAAEYFDEIVQDETAKTINCKIGGQNALVLGFNGSSTAEITIYLKNGVKSEYSKSGRFIEFAVKTSKGLYLKVKNSLADIFVTRDNGGSVAFVGLESYSSQYYPTSASFENSVGFWQNISYFSSMTTSAVYCVGVSQITSMCPMVCNGGVYTPDLNFVLFTENFGLNGRISNNGTEYYYDGIFALKE